MVDQVRKNDESIEEFDKEKLAESLRKTQYGITDNVIDKIVEKVISYINDKYKKSSIVTTLELRSCVINVLEQLNLNQLASIYKNVENNSKPDIVKNNKGNWSSSALEVLKHRYLQKDSIGNISETPEDMFWRVANNIAQAEVFYGDVSTVEDRACEFYNLMINRRFMPNSPTLMNAGRELQMLSACFVIPVPDDMAGILDSAKAQGLIQKAGGGTGMSFSNLRPKGDRVGSTQGVSSGPISFMKIFDAVTDTIKQGGKRRGANMGVMSISHPDILNFIISKLPQTKKKDNEKPLENFNISVAITDEFMRCVKEGTDFNLVNPRNDEVVSRIDARKLFGQIVYSAWSTGDPGILFIDRINEDNFLPELGEIQSTNPCLSANTWVVTENGPQKIKDILNKKIKLLLNGKYYNSTDLGFFNTGNKKLYKIITKEGYEIEATKNHLFLDNNGNWVKLKNINVGDKLKISNNIDVTWNGEGTDEDLNINAYNLGFESENITEEIEKTNSDFYKEFLRGYFDAKAIILNIADSLYDSVQIRLSSTNLNNLKNAQRMLLRLGIVSKILLYDKKSNKNIQKYELVIRKSNVETFSKLIGFNGLEKAMKNNTNYFNQEDFNVEVAEIIEKGKEDVYDVQVPEKNSFSANGFVVHNCGEIPMHNWDACNLGSINLAQHLRLNDNNEYKIDWDKLEDTVKKAINFLDNVVDMSKFPIQEINDTVKSNRRIGLGIMGFHDVLILMETSYASEKAVSIAEKIMRFISDKSREASIDLAKIRGNFPNYENSLIRDIFGDVPMRNSYVNTIAPTGTTGIIAGPIASGCEPYFGIAWRRQSRLTEEGVELIETNPLFEQIAKREGFYSNEILEKVSEEGSVVGVKDVPEKWQNIFSCAMDIPYEWHIKMQAAFQKYVDNSISKTINMKNNAEISDVEKAYFTAWELRCKGITVYRDGCKDEQVLNLQTKDNKKKQEDDDNNQNIELAELIEQSGGCSTCESF